MKFRVISIQVIFFLCMAFYVRAQQPHILDSLVSVSTHFQDDTNKVKLLIDIGKRYANDQPDKALEYLHRAGALSEKLGYTEGTFHYLFALAPVLGEMNRLDDCIKVSEQALALSKKIGNKDGAATACFDIAGGYAQKGQFENAINYYLQTDTILQQTRDTLKLCINYSKLSGAYCSCNQYMKAYEYGMRAIQLATVAGNEQGLCSGLLKTADALGFLGRYDSSLILYSQARGIYQKHGDDYDAITVLVNANNILKKLGRYEDMMHNADTIIALSEKVHRAEGYIEGLLQKATYNFYKKNFTEADKYASEALSLALKREHPQTVEECFALMADISLGAGNIPKYIGYRRLDDSVHEAIISDKILKNTQELETRYNVAEKENKIRLQQASLERSRLERTILIVALVLISVALMLGLLAYINKRRLLLSEKALQQQKIDRLETERQLVATKSVVQGQEEERSRLAKDLHDGLGGILSGAKYSLGNMKENLIVTPENNAAFERTMHMLELSITEMRRVAHNMMPESLMKLNLDEALMDYCEQVTVSGVLVVDYQSTNMKHLALNDTHKITVYRVVQELINNVAKHAAATSVIVQLFAKDNTLYLTVEDNGKGFDKSQLAFSSGIGFRNIKNRIDYLNGKLDVQSAPGKGTSVYIEIPLP